MALVLPEPEAKAASVRAMFDRIAPSYDRLNGLLTLRMDRAWRRAAMASAELTRGNLLVDVACGTGDFLDLAADAGIRAVGLDFSAGMIAAARRRGTGPLVRADALAMPLPDACADALTCGFALRNFVAIPPMLGEAARVLRPGGRLVLLEVATPEHPALRFGHALYFRRLVPWLGALFAERSAYEYLPQSTVYLPSPSELGRQVRDAGFRDIIRRTFGLGAVQLISARRRGTG